MEVRTRSRSSENSVLMLQGREIQEQVGAAGSGQREQPIRGPHSPPLHVPSRPQAEICPDKPLLAENWDTLGAWMFSADLSAIPKQMRPSVCLGSLVALESECSFLDILVYPWGGKDGVCL